MSRSDRDLEKQLHRSRPEPRPELLDELVAKAAPRPSRRSGRRLAPALGMTLILAVALAAAGGLTMARAAVSHTTTAAFDKVERLVSGPEPQSKPTLTGGANPSLASGRGSISNFGASHHTYPKPKLLCWIIAHDRYMRVVGLTTVDQGTISVTITKIAGGPDSNFPWTAPTVNVTSFVWGPTAQSPQGKIGRTYKATVTQTAAGYEPGTTYCFKKFEDDDDDD
jgi:hypothetical protein